MTTRSFMSNRTCIAFVKLSYVLYYINNDVAKHNMKYRIAPLWLLCYPLRLCNCIVNLLLFGNELSYKGNGIC